MEANDQGVDWREVAHLLNGANEMLVKRIDKLSQEFSNLQIRHEKMQELSLSFKNSSSRKN
ncbi:MAG: hypothetical protein F3745_09650 [Nitrospinae bacterium]|nr:hypothetical protein [Nitrospinota bacterium]